MWLPEDWPRTVIRTARYGYWELPTCEGAAIDLWRDSQCGERQICQCQSAGLLARELQRPGCQVSFPHRPRSPRIGPGGTFPAVCRTFRTAFDRAQLAWPAILLLRSCRFFHSTTIPWLFASPPNRQGRMAPTPTPPPILGGADLTAGRPRSWDGPRTRRRKAAAGYQSSSSFARMSSSISSLWAS